MAGRPTLLTPERQQVIVEALRRGNFRQTAVALADISYQTFLNWMERGEAGEHPYLGFLEAVTHAESEAEDWAVRCIQAQAPLDWRAAEALLRLRFKDRWSRQDVVELRTRRANEKLPELTPEQLEQLDALLSTDSVEA